MPIYLLCGHMSYKAQLVLVADFRPLTLSTNAWISFENEGANESPSHRISESNVKLMKHRGDSKP